MLFRSMIRADGPVALTKARFLGERESLATRNAALGLLLRSGEDLDGLEPDIARFALIVLDIAKYNDGRLYSIARLARERFGFKGELRARGDILRDQIALLHRIGIDSFEIAHEGTIEALRSGEIVSVRRHYQRSARDGAPLGLAPTKTLSAPGDLPGVGKSER